MAELVLVRHGRADGNSLHRFLGWGNVYLDEAGRRQAAAAADRLAHADIDVIVTSDLARAVETATVLGDRLGVPVEHEARLREIDNGEWTLRLPTEIATGWPDLWEAYTGGADVLRPGGERWADVGTRVVAALTELLARPERVAVVTHGGPVLIGAAWVLGIVLPGNIFQGPLALPANASVSTIAPGPRLAGYNDIGHLHRLPGVEIPYTPVT